MRIFYKIGTIILIIIISAFFNNANAQYKYSIDIKPVKDNRVSLKFAISSTKENYIISSEIRKRKRIEKKTSKKIRKHIYSIQTQKVKKRMRQSVKKADNYNRQRLPLSVKLKNILNG